jgi:flagellar biosynthesis protein FliP
LLLSLGFTFQTTALSLKGNMSYTEQLKFWFEQSTLVNGELIGLLGAALILSPLPRLLIIFSAINIGFNGFPGKFVSLALALVLTIVQLEATLFPIFSLTSELAATKGTISSEQKISLLRLSESQWDKYLVATTQPQYQSKIESLTSGKAETIPFGRKATSFLLSELDRAFKAALIIVLPLLVIELLVGTAISALDLELETRIVSFPLKLALFLSTSGWMLITETLFKLAN